MTASGKRERRYFGSDKAAAEKHAASLRAKYQKGVRGSLLDPATALQAVEAVKILSPLGIGLVEAARMAEARWKVSGAAEVFANRYHRFCDEQAPHWRPRYAQDMAKIPRWVGPGLMRAKVGTITPDVIRAALRENGATSPSTVKMRLARVLSVVSAVGKKRRAEKIEIMARGQCAAMLRACEDASERRAVALLLFAGIRPDAEDGEISRLDWSHVGNEIYIPHEVAKTGTDRHIPITPRLARLIRGRPESGPVLPPNWKRKVNRLRKAVGILGQIDITRHTFASHFLAAFGEDKTKAAMGHTAGSDTLFRRYRRSVTEERGRSYFGLK